MLVDFQPILGFSVLIHNCPLKGIGVREFFWGGVEEVFRWMRIEIVEGVPFEEILKCIDVERVDLVIMGNKGRSNLASTLFGSTAEKVFKYSNVPVVSVRNTM